MTYFSLKNIYKSIKIITLTLVCFFLAPPVHGDTTSDPPRFPVPEKVTLLNVYSEYCFACRMLKPVLEKIKEDFSEKLAVVDLEAERNLALMREMNVRAVPVLFFYDRDGNLHLRHEGFMKEERIRTVLQEMGLP